jgi:hypothetical protein
MTRCRAYFLLDDFRPDDFLLEDLRPEDLRLEDLRPEDLRPEDLRPEDLRPEDLRPEDLRDDFLLDDFFFGTFAPDLRASERPIAIACLRLLTFLPLFPLLSVPRLRSCIARFTFDCAFFPYLAMTTLRVSLRDSSACISAGMREIGRSLMRA